MSPEKYRIGNRIFSWGEWLYGQWRESVAAKSTLAEYARTSLPEYEKLREDAWMCWEELGSIAASNLQSAVDDSVHLVRIVSDRRNKDQRAEIEDLKRAATIYRTLHDAAIASESRIKNLSAAYSSQKETNELLKRDAVLSQKRLAAAKRKISKLQIDVERLTARLGHLLPSSVRRREMTIEEALAKTSDDMVPHSMGFCSSEEEAQVRELIESATEISQWRGEHTHIGIGTRRITRND